MTRVPGHSEGLEWACSDWPECQCQQQRCQRPAEVLPKRTRVYLAGPMRGYPEYNFPAFHEATADLRERGYEVWSPAERDEAEGFDPKTDEAKSLAYYMAYDLKAVCESDAVVVLDGWEDSQGARLEVHVAREIGLPVWRWPLLEPIHAHSDTPQAEDTYDLVIPSAPRTDMPTEGARKSRGVKLSLIPPYPLWRVAEVYTLGAAKYADHNWRQGRPASEWLDALERHLARYTAGEDYDPDGQHHLASVVFHAFALMEQEVTHPELDDRYKDGAPISPELVKRFVVREDNHDTEVAA